MPSSVLLKVIAGPLSGTEHRFEEPTVAIAGRSRDCNVKLPNDEAHGAVSRMHCFMDVNPPSLRVRDFGSRNGTFVNGKMIGKRDKALSIKEGRKLTFPEIDCKHGDKIQIGTTVFEVKIHVPLACVSCGREALPVEMELAGLGPRAPRTEETEKKRASWRCPPCKEKALSGSLVIEGTLDEQRSCARCGAPTQSQGDDLLRRGEVLCEKCRDDKSMLAEVLAAASSTFDPAEIEAAKQRAKQAKGSASGPVVKLVAPPPGAPGWGGMAGPAKAGAAAPPVAPIAAGGAAPAPAASGRARPQAQPQPKPLAEPVPETPESRLSEAVASAQAQEAAKAEAATRPLEAARAEAAKAPPSRGEPSARARKPASPPAPPPPPKAPEPELSPLEAVFEAEARAQEAAARAAAGLPPLGESQATKPTDMNWEPSAGGVGEGSPLPGREPEASPAKGFTADDAPPTIVRRRSATVEDAPDYELVLDDSLNMPPILSEPKKPDPVDPFAPRDDALGAAAPAAVYGSPATSPDGTPDMSDPFASGQGRKVQPRPAEPAPEEAPAAPSAQAAPTAASAAESLARALEAGQDGSVSGRQGGQSRRADLFFGDIARKKPTPQPLPAPLPPVIPDAPRPPAAAAATPGPVAAPQAAAQQARAQASDAAKSNQSGAVRAPAGYLGTFAGYQLLRRLAADETGGLGDGYVARMGAGGDEVEVRVILPRVAVSEAARKSFLDDLAEIKALAHPNLQQVLSFGHVVGAFFLVYERGRGLSAEALVRARGALKVADAVDIALQSLDALAHVHEAQQTHRDVSPRTVRVARSDMDEGVAPRPAAEAAEAPAAERLVKLADCGLARAYRKAGLADPNMTGDCVGTPAFMPRQQLLNFKESRASFDVWAAAATLYYLLTGSYPRAYDKDGDAWKVTLTEPPVPILQRRADLPARLAQVIDEALDDRKELKHDSAAALAALLREGSR